MVQRTAEAGMTALAEKYSRTRDDAESRAASLRKLLQRPLTAPLASPPEPTP